MTSRITLKVVKERLFERIADMPFEERILNFNDKFIWDMYNQVEEHVINRIKIFDEGL